MKKFPHIPMKFGVRFMHGKLLFFVANNKGEFLPKTNPGEVVPAWAVDIREVLAMFFVGLAALFFIWKDEYSNAMVLLVGLLAYATGRTVPGGKQIVYKKKEQQGETG